MLSVGAVNILLHYKTFFVQCVEKPESPLARIRASGSNAAILVLNQDGVSKNSYPPDPISLLITTSGMPLVPGGKKRGNTHN